MSRLLGKRVLFLAPSFFEYYKSIEDELKKQGCKVDTILENFSDSSYLYRFIYIKNERLRFKYTQKYYVDRLEQLTQGYDYVFVIRGEALTAELLMRLRDKNPNALFIMYQWDSIRNNRNCLEIESFFDYIYTFDLEDAKERNWKYRPLFYINTGSLRSTKEIDFSMVGTH